MTSSSSHAPFKQNTHKMSLTDQIGVYEQEIKHLLQTNKEDKHAVNDAITRFHAISAELKSIQRDQDAITPTNNLHQLRQEVAALEDKKNALAAEAEQNKADMTAELESLAEKIEHMKENRGPLRDEFDDLRQRVTRLHNKAEKETEINETIRQDNVQLVASIDTLTIEKQQKQQAVDGLRSEIETKQAQIAKAEEKYEMMNATKLRVLNEIENETSNATNKVI